ncbi:fatty acyl-AMP ligase [Larkinella rosea]|uniref:Fatty acyl-AMP ligase n=1 Tax=Larkinella rosea TaxID=2025312 RepID=A0A3P1BA59_9BACT|nr:fatty acyl-AMP ligase [Larkinella rosea]RRA97702.1 fatty acyl-AMP ligase [Larkinella rosea]
MIGTFKTIVETVRFRATHTPDQTAFVYLKDGETDEESLTYNQLHSRARAIARHLSPTLPATSDRPLFLLVYPQGLEFIEAFLGCLYAGAVAVPIAVPGKNRGANKIGFLVEDAGIKTGLTTTKTYELLQKNFSHDPWFQSLNWLVTDTIPTTETPEFPLPAPDDLALLQYTSGSTSQPKGVMVTHANIMANSAFIQHAFQNDSSSVSVCWLPSFHDMGLIDGIMQPIYCGFKAVLLNPVHVVQRPLRWLRAFDRYGGTYGGAPNFIFDFCVDRSTPDERAQLDLSRVKHIYNAAEPIRASTLHRFTEAFAVSGFSPKSLFTCFGLAESTLAVTMCRVDRQPSRETVDADALTEGRIIGRPAGTPDARELVCSGWPMSDSVLRIVDPETGRVCEEGEIGEIWTKGPSVTRGYWNKPELTVESFAGYTQTGEGPFLRTGDAGYFREKEGLFVTGRLKDLIIIRGANHYPQDIELTVEQCHEALASNAGAAFSVYTNDGEQLVVIHELKRAALPTAPVQDIAHAILREIGLRHALAPVAVVLLRPNGLFKTTSGKVQRSACQRAFLENSLAEHYRWDSIQVNEKQT